MDAPVGDDGRNLGILAQPLHLPGRELGGEALDRLVVTQRSAEALFALALLGRSVRLGDRGLVDDDIAAGNGIDGPRRSGSGFGHGNKPDEGKDSESALEVHIQ